MRTTLKVSALVLCFFARAFGTSQNKEVSALELLTAAKSADARSSGQNFRIRAVIKLEETSAVPTEGSYLLVWSSPTRWREEYSFSDFHQVRISAPGGVWEKKEPNFLPLRVWQVMQALSFYGRFELPSEESADKVKRAKKQGLELHCVEIKRNSYPLDEFCFRDGIAQLVSEHYLPSDRWYEFADYRTIRGKFFPGHIVVRDGKTLAAEFSASEVEEVDDVAPRYFEQTPQMEWRPWCASPDSGGDPLTPIYSGLAQHKGASVLYAAIATDGQIHRVHLLESGGASHDAEVLEGLKKERWKPSSCKGVPIMVETVFRR